MNWNLAFGLSLAVVLAACGGDKDDSTDTGTDEADTDTDTDTDSDTDTDTDTDSDTDTDTDADTDPTALGGVRVLHLSPDAGNVDVFLDGNATAILTDVPFLAGTGYLPVPVGSHTFDIAPAGAGIGAAVLSATVDVMDGVDYSATAYGTVANGTLAVLPQVDDTTGLASGDLRLQIAHTADGIGQVDVWELSGPTALLSDVDFGVAAAVDVPAAAYGIGLDTDDDGAPDWTFSVPNLGADVLVDVYAVYTQDDGPFLAAHLPDGTVAVVNHDPRIRVLHASPPTPAVDVLVDEGFPAAITGLSFGEGTGYLTVPPATYNFKVIPAGQTTPTPAALDFDLPLVAGNSYAAVAWGNSMPMAAALTDSVAGLAAGNIRLQVVHGAEGAGTVNVVEADSGTVLVPNFAEGDVGTLDLPAAAYAVGLDLGMDGSTDVVFDVPNLGADILVNVVAVLDGAVPRLVAHLPDGSAVVLNPRPN